MSEVPPPHLGDLPPGFDGARMYHKRAVAALACGIIGFVFFPLVLGVVAIVLGVQARQAIRTEPFLYKGENLAISAIVLGALSVVLFVVVVTVGLG